MFTDKQTEVKTVLPPKSDRVSEEVTTRVVSNANKKIAAGLLSLFAVCKCNAEFNNHL